MQAVRTRACSRRAARGWALRASTRSTCCASTSCASWRTRTTRRAGDDPPRYPTQPPQNPSQTSTQFPHNPQTNPLYKPRKLLMRLKLITLRALWRHTEYPSLNTHETSLIRSRWSRFPPKRNKICDKLDYDEPLTGLLVYWLVILTAKPEVLCSFPAGQTTVMAYRGDLTNMTLQWLLVERLIMFESIELKCVLNMIDVP